MYINGDRHPVAPMSTSKTNPVLVDLIDDLKEVAREESAPIWRDVAQRLQKPRRQWAEVNVSQLQRVLDDGDVAVVPGKLLGSGRLQKSVTVGAFQYSDGARETVEDAGGTVAYLEDLVDDHRSGEGVRILG